MSFLDFIRSITKEPPPKPVVALAVIQGPPPKPVPPPPLPPPPIPQPDPPKPQMVERPKVDPTLPARLPYGREDWED